MLRTIAAIFFCLCSTPALCLTYTEIAKICVEHRREVPLSDCVRCARDAMKFCSDQTTIPGAKQCLISNKENISSICKKVLEKYT